MKHLVLCRLGYRVLSYGKCKVEDQASSTSIGNGYVAAMKQSRILNNRQTESCAPCSTGASFVNSVKTFKQIRQMFLANSVSIVIYDKPHSIGALFLGFNHNLCSSGICNRIIYKIIKYRLEQ